MSGSVVVKLLACGAGGPGVFFSLDTLFQNHKPFNARYTPGQSILLEEVMGSIPGLVATISETGYFLLPSHNMAERSLFLKRRKSSKQTKQKKR